MDTVVNVTAASCVCQSQSLLIAPSNYVPTNWKRVVRFFKVDISALQSKPPREVEALEATGAAAFEAAVAVAF